LLPVFTRSLLPIDTFPARSIMIDSVIIIVRSIFSVVDEKFKQKRAEARWFIYACDSVFRVHNLLSSCLIVRHVSKLVLDAKVSSDSQSLQWLAVTLKTGFDFLSLPPSPDWLWGPPNLFFNRWVLEAPLVGAKKLEREANRTPKSIACPTASGD
jgi:hypothetical protein